MCDMWRRFLCKRVGSLDDPLVSLRAGVGGLGRGVGGGVVGLLVGVAMVVIKIMLSVSSIAIIPLQLNNTNVSHCQMFKSCLPWPWMCGPSVRGTPPCCAWGCPSCIPTRMSCVRGHWCTGSTGQGRRNPHGGWAGGPQGPEVSGSQRRPPRLSHKLLPGKFIFTFTLEKLYFVCVTSWIMMETGARVRGQDAL